MPTLLVTGFGPFPGAPFNPTGPLVKRLAKLRRPALADVTIITHVFQTSYASIDHDLPALIARHKPDALLMFGLASRSKYIRIETHARNALALLPDASSASPRRRTIEPGGPAILPLPAQVQRLLAAVRPTSLRASLSHDAGRYLCNYLCWRMAQITRQMGGPRLAAFVHVPLVRRNSCRRTIKSHRWALDDLVRAGERLMIATAASARQ